MIKAPRRHADSEEDPLFLRLFGHRLLHLHRHRIREDRISARSLGRLLAFAYANQGMSKLMASLPILGADGTLHRRFKHEALRRHGHLKTGTIAGTTGLAGFVDDRTDRRWIMVSLINNPRLQTWRGKAMEEAVLRWIYGEPVAGCAAGEAAPCPEKVLGTGASVQSPAAGRKPGSTVSQTTQDRNP